MGWLKRISIWFGSALLCLSLTALLLFIKFSRDLGAYHEKEKLGETLASVAIGKSIQSGEEEGTFSLDDPDVGLATKLMLDDLPTRTWRFRAGPVARDPEFYGVALYQENRAEQFWSGAVSIKSPVVKAILESK